MSFYSYKNANTCTCPGTATGNDILNGLNKRVCIQVKNVYDACLQQEQLSDKKVVVSNIVPALPAGCGFANPPPAGRPGNSYSVRRALPSAP